ncbi:MAG: ATP-binding protein [Sulfitobacter sp.]
MAAVFIPVHMMQLALGAAALTLCLLICLVQMRSFHADRARNSVFDAIAGFITNDSVACIVADSDGRIRQRNEAAKQLFGRGPGLTISGVLAGQLANPGAVVFRLQNRAWIKGTAREDMVTRDGHLRISAHDMGADGFVWRAELLSGSRVSRSPGELYLPMVMVGRTGTILFMNDAARELIGGRVKTLDRIFTHLPLRSGEVMEVASAGGAKQMLIAEVDAGAGRRALYFLENHTGMATRTHDWHALEELPVPMIKIGGSGQIDSFNHSAADLIGEALTHGCLLGELMEGLGRPVSDWLEDSMAGRLVKRTEFLRLKRTDKEIFVQVTLNRVTEQGKPGLIAVLSDATELKSLEAQFVQSQKMQAIGQLAGGVAHDFNNLLTAISGHCDLLLLRNDEGSPDYGDLMQISQNANRAAALVGQLLAFSRKQTLRPETLDMRDTLADLTHLMNRLVGEKITLTLSHDPVIAPIRADKRQIEQVLVNLVVNARDAMPGGGEIRIATQGTHLAQALVRDRATVPPGDYVTVMVRDAGMGIAPDNLQKVFEPFYTTKRTGEGTGLGLSTAYGIIKQSGGYIFVDSDAGVGTCFSLYFPVLSADAHAVASLQTPAIEPPRPPAQGEGVVLLVEDEAPVRAFASRALRLRGYTVLEAESAEAALHTLEDETLKVDIFVTDVVMPGMDGPTWVREAQKMRPDVRVVFVSGYAEECFGETQNKIANSVFLPKPFSLTDLTETVQRQLC